MAILYITEQGAVLHRSGNQIIVKKDRDVLQEIPIIQLDEVVIFGNGHITTPAIGYLLHKNIRFPSSLHRGSTGENSNPAMQRIPLFDSSNTPCCEATAVSRIGKMFCPWQTDQLCPLLPTATDPKRRRSIGDGVHPSHHPKP